jgi:hypothetical protein
MGKTFAEKIQEYRLRYITPLTFYTKKNKDGLRHRVNLVPTLSDEFLFLLMVIKEILVRLVLFPFRQHTVKA